MTQPQCTLPIGIFDSGMGGITVLKALADTLPQENLLYLGDTARLPYGTKSNDTIGRYSRQAAGKLVERGIKMLVIACNTATSAALPLLQKAFSPLPVLGVIEPGAHAATAATRSGSIAVIATEATIQGGAYQKAIHTINPACVVTARPCTLFVPLCEEGWTEGPIVEAVCQRYLGDIFCNKPDSPDTLMLGCTHYPVLKQALQQVVGQNVAIVDSAASTAEAVAQWLAKHKLLCTAQGEGTRHFLTTDNPARFARTGSLFWGKHLEAEDIELIDL
ncbi:MAG: glutamate racemase [Desulfovibrionaceae bacterium]|nr:glutamate racemase [Desulfovibrionaceae bacterium]